ncbi:MAG: hypothetical protein QG594_290 [Bacteroidota bacterium]|nr:hypothetical protein [Bacteroidota bacterium]
MENRDEKKALKEKIVLLKIKKETDLWILKNQYNCTIESLKPLNILKSVTTDFITAPDLKSNLINGAINLGTQYLSKNILNNSIANSLKQFSIKIFRLTLTKIIEKKYQKTI